MQQLKLDGTAGRPFSVDTCLESGVDYDGKVSISVNPEQLIGAAGLVYAKCLVFKPTLEYLILPKQVRSLPTTKHDQFNQHNKKEKQTP
jgi:hypothetical protein